MSTLLVIDDEPAILECFRIAFAEPTVTVLTAATATAGLDLVARQRPDVVVLDVNLPDLSGLDTYRRLRELDSRIPTIFMTGQGTTSTAIEAMSLGAYEYLLKPLDLDQLDDVVRRALEVSRLMRVPAVVPASEPDEPSAELLVGRTPAMQEVYKAIGRVALQNVTVLILGESGTGKELVARAVYHYSHRAAGPFLAINCAAIPETLLESELFGHEKGAFTSAERRRIGKFEQCSGGTLFLDEIGDMTPLTQSKILRVMQEQRFERVGGNETLQTDVRLLAATNRDLEQMTAAGQFRTDLYYRLNVFTIHLPSLRDRGDDIPLLLDHFLKRFNRELGKEVQLVAPAALDMLRRHTWPGNVRELQSVLKQALLNAAGPVLLPEHFPMFQGSDTRPGTSAAPASTTEPSQRPTELEQFVERRLQTGSEQLYDEWLALAERQLLTQVLRHTNGNQSQAAKILGLHRSTLRAKIASLGISIGRSVNAEEE